MRKTILPNVEEIGWAEAKSLVAKGCKELYKILEDISPPNDLTFIKVKYPFGTYIQHDDEIYIPLDDNRTLPLSALEIPQKLKEKLGYRSIPLGIITDNPVEIFRETDDRIFSVVLSGPNKGIEIGIFEYFGLTPCFSATAGARSLFMVPHIAETLRHKRLMKHYGAHIIKPNSILKHWNLFRSLTHSPFFKTKWYSEMLYFTKAWDDTLKKNQGSSHSWENLKKYLYMKGFEHSDLARRKLVLEVLWQKIAEKLSKDGAKVDPYTIDTLKHLIYIFLGGTSGSRPAIDDYAGPLTEIKNLYVDCYGLDQIPTIMRPHQFSLVKNIPVYYSMQNPMMISSSPYARKPQTIIEEMRDLMLIKNILAENFGRIKINDIKLHELVNLMNLEFFHADHFSYGHIVNPSTELAELDTDFLNNPTKNNDLTFADNGSFIRGCIKVSKFKD